MRTNTSHCHFYSARAAGPAGVFMRWHNAKQTLSLSPGAFFSLATGHQWWLSDWFRDGQEYGCDISHVAAFSHSIHCRHSVRCERPFVDLFFLFPTGYGVIVIATWSPLPWHFYSLFLTLFFSISPSCPRLLHRFGCGVRFSFFLLPSASQKEIYLWRSREKQTPIWLFFSSPSLECRIRLAWSNLQFANLIHTE